MSQASRWRSDVKAALDAEDETIEEDPHLKQVAEALAKLGYDRKSNDASCKAA